MKLLFIFLGILLVAVFIHPSTQVYEAQISGFVLDSKGNPVSGATVRRVSEIDSKKANGSHKTNRIYSGVTTTDHLGRYVLPELRRTVFFHSPMEYLMPWVHCYAFIEVSSVGYSTYVSEFGDEHLTLDSNELRACNGVSFIKKVT